MKKLFALMMALAMLLCGVTVFAEDTEPLAMEHDTAIVYVDGVRYDCTLLSVENPGNGFIDALFIAETGEIAGIAISDSIKGGDVYYEAGPDAPDTGSVAFMTPEGVIFTSSCSDYGYEGGYGCDIGISAYDVDGWYQLLAMGTLHNDESGETHEITVAFDFMYYGEAADEAADEAVAEAPVAAPVEAPAEEASAEDGDEYFIPDVLQVVCGDYYGEMELASVDTEDGVFVMYADDEGNLFAIGIYEELSIGEYYPDEVDDEYAYFMLSTATEDYLGGCTNYVDDETPCGDIYMLVNADGTDGLYQIGFMGEMINITTGEAVEAAGFADFTIK